MSDHLIEISQQLLYNVKLNLSTSDLVAELAIVNKEELSKQLTNDIYKKAFWINIYNAFIQILLQGNTDVYAKRRTFFRNKQLVIAKEKMSLDDIEHGILRRSKINLILGYVTNPFVSNFERKCRVDKVDYRIHFCLNCGAASCPPIAFYKPELLNYQMNVATTNYLQNECSYDTDLEIVYVPAFLKWFWADFGTPKQVMQLLYNIGVVPIDKPASIAYKRYDWHLHLNNYSHNSLSTE